MSQTDRNSNSPDVLFRPAAHYQSVDEVLNDGELSAAEKRVILSSWASDMYAIESCPWLREVPGMTHPVSLKDILAALRQLDPDNDDDPPPRGAAAMRIIPLTRLNVFCRGGRKFGPNREAKITRDRMPQAPIPCGSMMSRLVSTGSAGPPTAQSRSAAAEAQRDCERLAPSEQYRPRCRLSAQRSRAVRG